MLTLVYIHYGDVIMGAIASQITSLTIVYSTFYSDADQRKHQSSASLAFVRGIHRGPVKSPRKWSVTRKMLPFDDVIMIYHELFHIIWDSAVPSSHRWECEHETQTHILEGLSVASSCWIANTVFHLKCAHDCIVLVTVVVISQLWENSCKLYSHIVPGCSTSTG